MRIDELPKLSEVIARHRLSARARLGQHFLLDLNVTDRIARAAGPLRDHLVIEVGPGPGGLTRSLLSGGAARVIAIERDRRCMAALAPLIEAAEGRLKVIEGDALEVDEGALAAAHGPGLPIKIVANLPYNIATVLLLKWLGMADRLTSMTLMFQKEVAERLIASPGGKAYGRLAVMTQWLCEARREFNLPASAFVPPPKVASSVVNLVPRPRPLAEAERGALERITAAGFGQRRKMVRSSLKTLGVDTGALLAQAGVEPTARAEDLPVEAFCALARGLDR